MRAASRLRDFIVISISIAPGKSNSFRVRRTSTKDQSGTGVCGKIILYPFMAAVSVSGEGTAEKIYHLFKQGVF